MAVFVYLFKLYCKLAQGAKKILGDMPSETKGKNDRSISLLSEPKM